MATIQAMAFLPLLSFFANGSFITILGYFARWVRVAPNLMFTSSLLLIAHPFALSTGPRLRLRSLSQAMNIDGPLITSTSTKKQMNILYHGTMSFAIALPMKPTPMPMAAKIPANLAMSKVLLMVSSLGSVFSCALFAFSVSPALTLLSFSAAFLLMRS